jgi:crotonobetainyl-CoA:carnitine CoA-transferase CaiB-like acyl-CoA transferase
MNGLPGYGTYSTVDGKWVALGVLTEAPFWSGLCRGLGLEHLDGLDLPQRIERKRELDAAVAEEISRRPLAEVLAALKKHDVPVSPVLDRDEMLRFDHFRRRGTVITDLDLLGEGRPVMGHPARYTRHPARSPGRVPAVGDDQSCSWMAR